LKYGKYHKL